MDDDALCAALRAEIDADERRIRELEAACSAPLGCPPPPLCPCPAAGCRGAVVESTRACGACGLTVCAGCLRPAHDGACERGEAAAAELLLRTTRACPTCAVRIERAEGCPDMWCTRCRRGFDWNTGRPKAGPVHNPHFFEHIFEDRAASRTASAALYRRLVRGGVPCADASVLAWRHQVAADIIALAATTRAALETDDPDIVVRLRLLDGQIDEARAARELCARDRRRARTAAVQAALERYARGVLRELETREPRRALAAVDELRGEAQAALDALAKRHRCPLPPLPQLEAVAERAMLTLGAQ